MDIRIGRRLSRGATLTELLYVLPLFFFLVFGIMEAAFFFRTRSTLNVATFQAARVGATHHAFVTPMRERLARGMIPLYMRGDSNVSNYAAAYATSYATAVGLRTLRDPVRIVSPTAAIFDAFKENRRLIVVGESNPTNQQVIPNDNLNWRSPATRTVEIGGENREINIQDANLLKITTYWCHQLKTPVLDRLIHAAASGTFGLPTSAEQAACTARGLIDGKYYLAVTSQAVVRMQSDVIMRDGNLN